MLLSFLKLFSQRKPKNIQNIFVLRNNDLGDVLTVTPLLRGLKETFPLAKIMLGVGAWSKPILEQNPYVDVVIPIDAPWHNKQSARYPHNSLKGWIDSLKYVLKSEQLVALKNLKVDIGIDVLGSPQGALLLLKGAIPYRLGVKGYAGGYKLCQGFLKFDPNVHVANFALEFLKLLGGTKKIKAIPELYLSEEESLLGESRWRFFNQNTSKLRILVAPGAGFLEKCWGRDNFKDLLKLIDQHLDCTIVCIGSKKDKNYAHYFQKYVPNLMDTCGIFSLREVFALTKHTDYIITNSSMLMHVGAAFAKKTLVLLGPAITDSKAHEKLWSYPDTHIVMGKNSPNDLLPNPVEAFEVFKKHLKSI